VERSSRFGRSQALRLHLGERHQRPSEVLDGFHNLLEAGSAHVLAPMQHDTLEVRESELLEPSDDVRSDDRGDLKRRTLLDGKQCCRRQVRGHASGRRPGGNGYVERRAHATIGIGLDTAAGAVPLLPHLSCSCCHTVFLAATAQGLFVVTLRSPN